MNRLRDLWLDRRYQIDKRRERLTRWIVWRLPARWVYWAVIRVGAHATTGPYESTIVTDMDWATMLERWEQDKMKKRQE